mmetsp:Transcript_15281/g.52331  ORF Transcript_15281/g.52331 Transcript_15281/m.52331 type:complete len:387 (-) Transcript_15281:50-1210(-)
MMRTTQSVAFAKSKQADSSPYDIVAHSYRKPPGADVWARHYNKPPDSRTTWNIVNHQNKDGTKAVKTCPVPDGILPASWQKREFDIVSNKYGDKHEARSHSERVEARHSADRTFWKQRDFDPVQSRYYDDGKEAEFVRQRSVLASVQGAAVTAKLPPSMQFREGAAYDIVSHAVRDVDKLQAASTIGNRAISAKKGQGVEADLRSRAAFAEDVGRQRALNRFSRTAAAREREGGRAHGYDVLTGQGDFGLNARTRPPERIGKMDTAWQALSHSGADFVTATHKLQPASSNNARQPQDSGRNPPPRDLAHSASAPHLEPRAAVSSGAPVSGNVPMRSSRQPSSSRRPSSRLPSARDSARERSGQRGLTSKPSVPALRIPPPMQDDGY